MCPPDLPQALDLAVDLILILYQDPEVTVDQHHLGQRPALLGHPGQQHRQLSI
ncbi:MAG: hypothetical protein OER95_16285 [Acidimicrobiia bacterium]|nr:hypothetical protein [Acidimicrobiia bacterium]